jgi:mono/diheme cytochrome c family protein
MSKMRMDLSAMAAASLLVMGTIAVPGAHGNARQAAAQARFNGATLYRTHCASCHGERAHGDGAVAIFLRQRPADLTQIAKRNKGTFPADRVTQLIDGRQVVKVHGESQMPVWGDAFSKAARDADEASVKAKISALVDYLASIQERPAR